MPVSNMPALSLRVELDHIEPSIWREVTVPTNVTLERLHEVLQIVMGWENDCFGCTKLQRSTLLLCVGSQPVPGG